MKKKRKFILVISFCILMPLMIIYILGLLSLRVFDGTYVYDISSLYFSKEVKKIVVFVPHQDDDLFVAGPLIYNLRNKGIETKVVFFTDGNAHDNIGHIRQKEAIKAQAKLGVPKKDVICMQFPNRQQGDTTDVNGVSSISLRDSMKCAIKSFIKENKPQIIVCSDLDFNRDHRLLAILFDESLGELLQEDTYYRPVVLKGFSYQTSYNAVKDFYCMNIRSTQKPHDVQNKLYETDVPAYMWAERTRIPMSGEMATHASQTNVLYQALEEYRSQWVRDKTRSILNGDNVFWLKRSDNLLNDASVTVSSGNIGYLSDFKYYDSEDISIRHKYNLHFDNYLWEADTTDLNPEILVTFNSPKHVKELVLYDDPTLERNIESVDLFLNGKYFQTLERLPEKGLPKRVYIESDGLVTSLNLKNFICNDSLPPALVELEIFDKPIAEYANFSILKIKSKETDDFLYRYYVPKDVNSLELDYYAFGISGDVTWSIYNEKGSYAKLDNSRIIFGDEFSKCTVRLSSKNNPMLYDEVVFVKESEWDSFLYSFMTTFDKCVLDFETWFYRNRIVGSFIRHTTFNPIKRFLGIKTI